MSKEKDTKKEQEELKDSEMEQNTAATRSPLVRTIPAWSPWLPSG